MYSVIKYIHKHIDERLTVSELSKQFGYSKWYFCDLFKRFTGTTLVEYIRNYRMQLAVLDILDNVKIVDVATKYGYETQNGFNKAFLKEFVCLPREFKNKSERYLIAYKERRNSMLHISDRCSILRDNAVNKKSLNNRICAQRTVLFTEGVQKCKENGGHGNHCLIASGISNVINECIPIIQEGELIVGYNYADNPYQEWWNINDNDEDRCKLEYNGFSKEKVDNYYKYRNNAMSDYHYAPNPEFNKIDNELDVE